MEPTELKFNASDLHLCRINIVSNCNCSNIAYIKHSTINIKTENYFLINLKLRFNIHIKCKKNNKCPKFLIQLVNINKHCTILKEELAWPCSDICFRYESILQKDTVLGFKLKPFDDSTCKNYIVDNIKVLGNIDIDQHKYDQLITLKDDTDYDKERKVQYITQKPPQPLPPAPILPPQYPVAPSSYLWPSIVIPWRQGQIPPAGQNPPGPFPNANWYNKHQSVPSSIYFYLGLDYFTIPENSPELTIFLKNFQNRGCPVGGQNYLKKQYMSALSCDKMPKYKAKIDTFLNEVLTKITVGNEPVLSAFKDSLLKFFLAIHVGYDDYPEVVIKYFSLFLDIIGFGDPDRPGRDDAMIFGNTNVSTVKEYFAHRNTIIQHEKDETCIIYYWGLAGLPQQSLVIEAVHNIVAFSQFNNTLYLLISDKLWSGSAPSDPINVYGLPPAPTNPLPYWYPRSPVPLKGVFPIVGNVGPVNFFAKYEAALTDKDKMNVIRESFRILAPNTNSFSTLETGNPADPDTQCRHFWQLISIQNQSVPDALKVASFFKYDTNLYNGMDADFNCPAPPVPGPVKPFNPEDLFIISNIDNDPNYGDGTVQDKSEPNLIPVLSSPLYLPFGPSYRRCAGEILVYFITSLIIEKFKNVVFEVRHLPEPPIYSTFITLAPYKAVPNNIYVKKN
jgi:hypothetical protein